jgi:hypothetical protein
VYGGGSATCKEPGVFFNTPELLNELDETILGLGWIFNNSNPDEARTAIAAGIHDGIERASAGREIRTSDCEDPTGGLHIPTRDR